MAVGRKAILSLRLRLRSGLRQSGGVFDAGFIGRAEALPYRYVARLGFRGGVGEDARG